MARKLEIEVIGDTKHLEKALGNAGRSAGRFGRAVKVGAGVAAGALVGGLAVAAKIGFGEFLQGQKVAAQTGAVLKSTGGIANVTAKQIDDLAGSLMKKSGVDDEAIKSGSNMLLTFTKIRNEVGDGNDIFNQATTATLNLSVAMGKDMQSSAILVGKALNDPVKGVTALTKAGIQLTDAQKATIKSMVESGNVAGAQKIILKELETQFGGSAEAAGKTFGGQMNILKETFSNTAGEIVGRFVPALVTVATYVAPLILSALDAIGGLIEKYVSPQVSGLADAAEEHWPKIKDAASSIFNWIRDNIFPIILDLRDIFVAAVKRISVVLEENRPELERIFTRVGALIKELAKVIVPLLEFAFVTVLPLAIDTVIFALDKVTAAVEGITQVMRWLSHNAGGLWDTMKGAVQPQTDAIKDAINLVATAADKVKDVFVWLRDHGGPAVTAFKDAAAKPLDVVRDAFDAIWSVVDKIKDGIEWLIRNIGRIPKPPSFSLPDIIPGGDPRVPGAFGGLVPGIMDEYAGGKAFGLYLASGLRTPEENRRVGGAPNSDHLYGKAIDMAGPPAAMAGFFRWLIGQRDVKEAFYDPLGSVFGGILSSYREGGHSDHVHVATYGSGGIVPGTIGAPQFAIVHGGETILPTHKRGGGDTHFHFPNYLGSRQELTSWLRTASAQFERQNGRPAFGGA